MARGVKLALLGTGWLLWAWGAIWLAGAALAQAGPQQRARIVDFGFEPGTRTVDLGTTVTWTNTGARPHTVTDRGGTFDTRPIAPNASGKVTFTVPGTYAYFCRINPAKMNGVIVVRPGGQPSRLSRIQGLDPALPGEKLRFDPPDLEVQAGSTVLFANVGGKPHTLTADDGSFDTGVVAPGAEGGRFAGTNATITLSKPGRFPFHCEIHPAAMRGVLVVLGQNAADPTGQAAATPAAPAAPAKPPAATPAPSKAGLSWLALVTGVLGAFAGGFGISAFVRGRPRHG
jgi:plastocyanin